MMLNKNDILKGLIFKDTDGEYKVRTKYIKQDTNDIKTNGSLNDLIITEDGKVYLKIYKND